jgi:hypothetical protein
MGIGRWACILWHVRIQRASAGRETGRCDRREVFGACHNRVTYINGYKLLEKPDMWALFDQAVAPTYTSGRLCLMVDAAHASTHQGARVG